MNPTIIHKTKWFWPWQDNLEEAWLAQMSQQGLHLKQAHSPAGYDFVKGSPETYAYRLDFQDPRKNERRHEYLRLFADAGWDHLGAMGGWQYFRKKVQPGETSEIFTDADSKIQKYNRYLAYLGVTYPAVLVVLLIFRNSWPAWLIWVYAAVMLLFAVLAIAVSVKIAQRIRQLKLL